MLLKLRFNHKFVSKVLLAIANIQDEFGIEGILDDNFIKIGKRFISKNRAWKRIYSK